MHSTPTRVITVVFPVLTLLALGNYAGSQLFGESGPRPTFVSLPSKAISESGSKELERLPLINNLEIKRESTSSLNRDHEIARPKRDVLRLKLVAVMNNAVKTIIGDMSDLNPLALNVRRTTKSNIASEPRFHNLYQ